MAFIVKSRITHCMGDEPVVFEPGTEVSGNEFGTFLADHVANGALVYKEPPIKKSTKPKEGHESA